MPTSVQQAYMIHCGIDLDMMANLVILKRDICNGKVTDGTTEAYRLAAMRWSYMNGWLTDYYDEEAA